MGDPISVAGTVVGVVSLGIQVTQSLVSFYNSYKGQSSELGHTTDRLNSLLEIFQSLKKTLSDRKFLADEQDLVKNIETSIKNCDDLIYELQDEVQKFNKTSSKEPLATIKIAGHRVTYPFRQSTLQKLDEDIKDIRANISSALDALQLKDNKKIQDDIKETKDLLGLVRTSQVSLELRDWLKAPDAFIDHHAACAKKQPGSGVWLVKSDQFSSWLIEENSIMWLNGFVGSGKSILCSTAINFVLQHKRSDPKIGIAFFYFTFNDKTKQDESAMLRALLLQLSTQVQNNNADLTQLHNSCNTGVPPSTMLLDYLQRLIRRFCHVYIILDALDENPGSGSREHVLDALKTMRNWGEQRLHLLITSRDGPDIRKFLDLSPACQVKMQNSGIDKDIRDFISGQLDTDLRLESVLPYRERVQESLAARAKGMFRWVDCQLQTLRSCRSKYHLDSMLSSLPESLDETYERMLCNIESYWIEDARRMLTMLCFASRPLTVQELIDSVAVETGKSAGLNRERRLDNSNSIRDICGGLVDIVQEEVSVQIFHEELPPTVRIAQFSVQEYLESVRIRGQKAASFGLSSITAHAEIAEVCLIYLLEPGLSRSGPNQAFLEECPLAEFAATYWYYHFRKTESPTSGLERCILRFFQSQTSFVTWVRLHDVDWSYAPYFVDKSSFTAKHSRQVDDIPAPTYYASLLGLDKVLHELLHSEQVESTKMSAPPLTTTPKASKQTVSAAGHHGGAMQAASYHGNDHIIQILLDSGFDINAQGEYAKGSALNVASFEGHEKVVRILLDRGADVNAKSSKYGSALRSASERGFKEVVQMLLGGGADVDVQSKWDGGSALLGASKYGRKEVVQMLLDRGANVNAQSRRDGSALLGASKYGREEIVQMLLDRGADINAQSIQGTAICRASERGSGKIVQMLLDSGARVSIGRSNALLYAVEQGHSNIVQMLLDNMDAEDFDNEWRMASSSSDDEIMELLQNHDFAFRQKPSITEAA